MKVMNVCLNIAPIDGLGKETLEWLINDIKPYIDSHYRTYPFRQATGIAGSSMGVVSWLSTH